MRHTIGGNILGTAMAVLLDEVKDAAGAAAGGAAKPADVKAADPKAAAKPAAAHKPAAPAPKPAAAAPKPAEAKVEETEVTKTEAARKKAFAEADALDKKAKAAAEEAAKAKQVADDLAIAAQVARAKAEDRVLVNSPSKFSFFTEDGKRVHFEIGNQTVPKAAADHRYAKAHGVTILGTPAGEG